MRYTAQNAPAPEPGQHTVFLSGPAGTGKTTMAVRHLHSLVEQGVPGELILVLVPQRALAVPYLETIRSPEFPAGGQPDVATIGGLARRTIDLFWPLVAEAAGFAQPNRRPRFLTIETAQYHMNRVVEPFLASGAFDAITIPRARLVSQIIDDLNKAAAVGFPVDSIALRLKRAWSGDSARLRIYDEVQAVANSFRQACLSENLLDWSLQIELFWKHLLPLAQVRRYLLGGYQHLIVDNSEEDIPCTHDLLRLWLPRCLSALVVHDTDGGYRVFLGADPEGALALGSLCKEHAVLTTSHVSEPAVTALGEALAFPFMHRQPGQDVASTMALVLPAKPLRFHPQMLHWVAEEVSRLVHEQKTPPREIAVLAPFVSDSLRFALTELLNRYGIPVHTHRPSRQVREEPVARCLLTLAKLAHPTWFRPPAAVDVAQALTVAVADMDPIRARLLVDILYRVKDCQSNLSSFESIIPETQERITRLLGGRYDTLREWIVHNAEAAGTAEGLDHFFGRLFGEVLSQAGFGFHHDMQAGAVVANLIESVAKFRQGVAFGTDRQEAFSLAHAERSLAVDYLDLLEQGLLAAQYVPRWAVGPESGVLLMPAYTFLMVNRPVSVQFWLDAGSLAWFERLYQPLTHPYVLRRDWPDDKIWTDDDEVRTREQALARLILGLSRRCRHRIYLAFSELNERGYEQRGPLLMAVQRLLRHRVELARPARKAGTDV